MKLLHVITSLNPLGGGPAEGVKLLAAQYKELGVEVELACCDAPDSPWLTDSRLPRVHALGPAKLGYSYTPGMVNWLKANTPRFDAVIVDGIWQFHLRAVALACNKTDVPYFVFTHGMLGPWFKKNFPFKHLKKSLYWLFAEYWHLKRSASLLFTCEEERLLARKAFFPYSFPEVVTGFGTSRPPCADDADVATLYNRFPELRDKHVILYLGRLHPIKGIDNFLHAYSKVINRPDLHLLVAGSGDDLYLAEMKDLAETLGIKSRVTFAGMLWGMDKWAALRLAEVMCLPSHHENFGVVVAEALAMGTPVLISNKVNIWREVQASGAGLVSDDTAEGAETSLREWLGLSHAQQADMRTNASNCFEKAFQIRSTAECLIKKIKESQQ